MQTANGTMAFADDLSGLPVHLDASFEGTFSGNVSADLTAVSPKAPPASEFAPPKSYKRTKNLMEVLMSRGRMVMPVTARPEPTPTSSPAPSAIRSLVPARTLAP